MARFALLVCNAVKVDTANLADTFYFAWRVGTLQTRGLSRQENHHPVGLTDTKPILVKRTYVHQLPNSKLHKTMKLFCLMHSFFLSDLLCRPMQPAQEFSVHGPQCVAVWCF